MTDEKGRVYRATLSRGELMELLKVLFAKGDVGIAQRVDNANLLPFQPDRLVEVIDQWDDARFFNARAELRWRRTQGGYSSLLLGELSKESLLAEHKTQMEKFQSVPGEPFSVVDPSSHSEHGFLLWGSRLDGNQWWEARIPRPLSYPGFPTNKSDKPPRLAYRLYLEGEAPRWTRLSQLVEAM